MAANRVNNNFLKRCVEDYFRDEPDGLDITAHVLNEIGFDDFVGWARVSGHKDASQEKQVQDAKQKMGIRCTDRCLPTVI
jgi:hypothetical protein